MECGKCLGKHEQFEFKMDFDSANKEYLRDDNFRDISDLPAKLYKLKCGFMKYDPACKGEIDYVTFHVMAQGLGIYRTLSELKRRVQEITLNTTDVVPYRDFLMAVLGRRSTMCQKILFYSENKGEGFVKMPCLMDCKESTFVRYQEYSVHPSPTSPFIPPPPPPSPADVDIGAASKAFSTVCLSFGKRSKRDLQ